MEIAIPGVRSKSPSLIARLVRVWVDACNDFRSRERREIIEQIPSPEQVSAYRAELAVMLRSARYLLALMEDPEYPAREFLPEISGKLLQLQSSWDSLTNPMSETEAEAMLKKAFPGDLALLKLFPDEKRAGNAA
jgi:hypothetical protein